MTKSDPVCLGNVDTASRSEKRFNADVIFPEESAPLSDVVFRSTAAPLKDNKTANRYSGCLVTRSIINGKPDQVLKPIGYQITRRWNSTAIPSFTDDCSGETYISQRFEFREQCHRESQRYARSEMNVSSQSQSADLSAVVYRLSAALAVYTLTGKLTSDDILAGAQLQVCSIQKLGPAGSAMLAVHNVIIMTDHILQHESFEALVCAVNGSGALVVTDLLNTENFTLFHQGHSLAYGCMVALQVLFSMYKQHGVGSIAGLAYAKGIHTMGTVVAASGEGGYMRDVLRCCKFGVPYGRIYVQQNLSCTNVPVFNKGDTVAAQVLIDGSLLKTAALTALCDPLVDIKGRKYPSVFGFGALNLNGGEGAFFYGEDDVDAANAHSHAIRRAVVGTSRKSCELYARGLGELVVGDSGGSETATAALVSMFNGASLPQSNIHTSLELISPYYWVEPTTLFQKQDKSAASSEGYGVLAGTRETLSSLAYPKGRKILENSHVTAIAYEHRSIRTVPALVHLYKHESGGLKHVSPYQMVPSKVCMAGGGHSGSLGMKTTVEETLRAGFSMDCYAWEHGAVTKVPSPAEFMYIGAGIGVRLDLLSSTTPWPECEENCVVNITDNGKPNTVEYSARAPCERGSGELFDQSTNMRRARNHAAKALEAASTGTAYDPVLFCEPGEFP